MMHHQNHSGMVLENEVIQEESLASQVTKQIKSRHPISPLIKQTAILI